MDEAAHAHLTPSPASASLRRSPAKRSACPQTPRDWPRREPVKSEVDRAARCVQIRTQGTKAIPTQRDGPSTFVPTGKAAETALRISSIVARPLASRDGPRCIPHTSAAEDSLRAGLRFPFAPRRDPPTLPSPKTPRVALHSSAPSLTGHL